MNLSADAPETAAYLRGETIQLSEEDAGKGWCLVSVDGYSLGWGKKSGGTLKTIIRRDCGSSINRRRKNPPASEP